MSTKSGTEIVTLKGSTSNRGYANIDDYLTNLTLTKTIGEVIKLRESCSTARVLYVVNMIFDAIFDKNIAVMVEIVQRIDGAVPKNTDRDNYANLFGSALDDVLDYTSAESLKIRQDDFVIIALAKTCYCVAISDPGKNVQKRKDKITAIEMINARTGGKKNEPTKSLVTKNYVEPDWLQLGSGVE